MKDYYKILGVPRKATSAQIKTAYRRLAKRYHPDMNPGDAAAAERFKEINEAYDTLGDKDKRSVYNFDYDREFTSSSQSRANEGRRSYTGSQDSGAGRAQSGVGSRGASQDSGDSQRASQGGYGAYGGQGGSGAYGGQSGSYNAGYDSYNSSQGGYGDSSRGPGGRYGSQGSGYGYGGGSGSYYGSGGANNSSQGGGQEWYGGYYGAGSGGNSRGGNGGGGSYNDRSRYGWRQGPDSNRRDASDAYEMRQKNRRTSILLCIFLGWFGAHKFYEGKPIIGTLYMTFLGSMTVVWLSGLITGFAAGTGGMIILPLIWIAYDLYKLIRQPGDVYFVKNKRRTTLGKIGVVFFFLWFGAAAIGTVRQGIYNNMMSNERDEEILPLEPDGTEGGAEFDVGTRR